MIQVRKPIFIIIISLCLFLSIPMLAYGDLVKGKVLNDGVSGFEIKNLGGQSLKSVSVEEGKFSVSLRPGEYTAVLSDGRKATIKSSKRPISGINLEFKQ